MGIKLGRFDIVINSYIYKYVILGGVPFNHDVTLKQG